MTLLDDIIAAATDSSASTPDLLRKVQVVARRVGSAEVEAWVRHELMGYPDDSELPPYRNVPVAPIGHFTGPRGMWREEQLTVRPRDLDALWTAQLRQPVQELLSLAEAEHDAAQQWSITDVKRYSDSRVFSIQFMVLFSVRSQLSRASLQGAVDNVKSKALELALDLQDNYPEAGQQGGPTVAAEPQLQQVINNFTTTNNITGHGANIAVGHGIEQRSKVQVGDEAALRRGAEELGLDAESVNHFISLVHEERDPDGTGLRSFLTRVRMGVIGVSEAVTTDVAATALIELAKGYLGL